MKAGLGLLPLASVTDSNLDGDADVIRCVRARSPDSAKKILAGFNFNEDELRGTLCVLK